MNHRIKFKIDHIEESPTVLNFKYFKNMKYSISNILLFYYW